MAQSEQYGHIARGAPQCAVRVVILPIKLGILRAEIDHLQINTDVVDRSDQWHARKINSVGFGNRPAVPGLHGTTLGAQLCKRGAVINTFFSSAIFPFAGARSPREIPASTRAGRCPDHFIDHLRASVRCGRCCGKNASGNNRQLSGHLMPVLRITSSINCDFAT